MIETDKDKIKERKQQRKKWQFHSLKAVEKLVLPNLFLLINDSANDSAKIFYETFVTKYLYERDHNTSKRTCILIVT